MDLFTLRMQFNTGFANNDKVFLHWGIPELLYKWTTTNVKINGFRMFLIRKNNIYINQITLFLFNIDPQSQIPAASRHPLPLIHKLRPISCNEILTRQPRRLKVVGCPTQQNQTFPRICTCYHKNDYGKLFLWCLIAFICPSGGLRRVGMIWGFFSLEVQGISCFKTGDTERAKGFAGSRKLARVWLQNIPFLSLLSPFQSPMQQPKN